MSVNPVDARPPRCAGRATRRPLGRWPGAAPLALAVILVVVAAFAAGCGRDKAGSRFAEAEELFGSGEYTAAVEQYSKLVKEFQSSSHAPVSQLRVAEIYDRHLADARRAIDAYSMLQYLFPESPEAGVARERVAELYARTGAHVRAAEEFERLAAERPEDGARLTYRAGVEYLEAGDDRRALERFTTVVERWEGAGIAPDAHYRIAYVHYLRGNSKLAIEEYDRLIERDPGGELAAEAAMGKARALEDAGRLREALEVLEGLIGRYPNEEALRVHIDWVRKRLGLGPGKDR